MLSDALWRASHGEEIRHGVAGRVGGFLRTGRCRASSRREFGRRPKADVPPLRPRLEQADKVGTSICPFCAVGCAQLVYAKDGRPIHIEGDPRSPINQGTLCPKGAATLGLLNSPQRMTRVKYRAPYSDHWEERPLDWAMERIAQLVKRTRDETFVESCRTARPSTTRSASARWAAPRSTTKKTT